MSDHKEETPVAKAKKPKHTISSINYPDGTIVIETDAPDGTQIAVKVDGHRHNLQATGGQAWLNLKREIDQFTTIDIL